jgi:hypothetical protein
MPICKNNPKKTYTGQEPSPKGLGYCAGSEKEGTKMKGSDGKIWIKKNGRWIKFKNDDDVKKILLNKSKTDINKTDINNTDIDKIDINKISLEKLKEINKKNKVTTSGTKAEIALRLWTIRSVAISDKDLLLIYGFVPKKEQQEIKKLVDKRNKNPIKNYKGLWEEIPKPISKMNRDELIKNLQKFRDAWEKITKINQDLSDDRLDTETVVSLRSLLKFYYSNEAKLIAENRLSKK